MSKARVYRRSQGIRHRGLGRVLLPVLLLGLPALASADSQSVSWSHAGATQEGVTHFEVHIGFNAGVYDTTLKRTFSLEDLSVAGEVFTGQVDLTPDDIVFVAVRAVNPHGKSSLSNENVYYSHTWYASHQAAELQRAEDHGSDLGQPGQPHL